MRRREKRGKENRGGNEMQTENEVEGRQKSAKKGMR